MVKIVPITAADCARFSIIEHENLLLARFAAALLASFVALPCVGMVVAAYKLT